MSHDDNHTSAEATGGPDVHCPNCGYSLRGLPGLVVRCPECGVQSYIPELMARRRRDWAENTLYNLLGNAAITLPIALAAIALPPVWLGLRSPLAIAIMTCGLALVGVWFGLLGRIFGTCGAMEAIRLTFLMQVLVFCFVVCGLVAPISIILLLQTVVSGLSFDDVTGFLRWLIGTGLAAGLALGGLRFCRYLDRAIGLRCIAWELESGGEYD
ncbi:MAG: hypothetical protein SYC29_18225 [Planctomycetota bacterium]|nr:hypothetical protein [Planctomycetota bacterium]